VAKAGFDCTAWNLFHNSNHTVAMKNVEYDGQIYQVPNHFFPWPLATLRGWTVSDSDIALQLPTAPSRFVADWMATRALSPEAQTLLDAGAAVYRVFYAESNQLRTGKFKIETWDAGWWQVRSAWKDRNLGAAELAAVKVAHEMLRDKLRPQLAEFGFLDEGMGSATIEPARFFGTSE
jgi:hypothetical protein